MKRLIITTIILLAATVGVTVIYFNNLNRTGPRTRETMLTIPDNAALILEINNDKGFYEIFNNSQLFTSFIGKQTIADLNTLRKQLLQSPQLEQFFDEQNIFISLHPLKNNTVELLLTAAANSKFKTEDFDELVKEKGKGLLITPLNLGGKKGYTIYSNIIKKRFYLLGREDGIFSGSFSMDLTAQAAQYNSQKHKQAFVLLPDQQNNNSLANLYVNYSQLSPLFEKLFKNNNTDIFKCFKTMPALAALSLNFKSDALMFNGFSQIQSDAPMGYLSLFGGQQPIANQLKDIFPSTTAYSISFAVSSAQQFKNDLSAYFDKAGLQHERDSIFNRVKIETGTNFLNEFNKLLGNEFAVVTTRYQEKLGIIALKDGSKLKPVLYNAATMSTDNVGRLNYNKLPYFLIGDAFSIFGHPWFMVIDNYLVLANTETELKSYSDMYINRKFQSKLQQYNRFDNLMAQRSNVTWYINIKNAQPILKNDLHENFYTAFENNKPGWKDFYAASYQLITSGKKFYTAFCMQLNAADSVKLKL